MCWKAFMSVRKSAPVTKVNPTKSYSTYLDEKVASLARADKISRQSAGNTDRQTDKALDLLVQTNWQFKLCK